MLDFNWIAIIVAAVAAQFIGFLWYGPFFGKVWAELVGYKKKDIEKMRKSNMTGRYLLYFLCFLISAFVLQNLVGIFGSYTFVDGIGIGFLVWLGFIATISLSAVLFENKPAKLYLLNNLFYLISFIVMGIILTVWR
jgi:hypothetical protein